jgi:5-methylcytosine-specific restriction endonuclease McrA
MKRSPIRRVSAKRATRDRGYPAARKAVYARSGGLCEAQVTWACTRRCEQVHHLAGRAGPNPHDLANLVGICEPCHRYIESNRAWAYETGWLLRRNTTI